VNVATPHSLYFWALLTYGWLGIAALTWLVVVLVARVVRAYRSRGSPQLSAWGGIAMAALFCWLLNEAKIEFVHSALTIDMTCAILALVPALSAASGGSLQRRG
jgi:O-antigen ligase